MSKAFKARKFRVSSRLAALCLSLSQLSPTAFCSAASLDLSSSAPTGTAGAINGYTPQTITEDGKARVIGAQDKITFAESIALNQVLHGGAQTLVLGAQGNAVGGSLILPGNLQATALTIPVGVTAVYNFGNSGPLNVAGPINNLGSLIGISTNQAVQIATINTGSVFNGTNAVISTIVPQNLISGLNLQNLVSNLSLNLISSGNIVNYGNISSSANLNIQAAGAISNIGAASIMQAQNNLAVMSQIGSIMNSGTISALAGNLTLNALTANNLIINSMGGSLQALNGAINLRDSLFSGKSSLSLIGGDILSKQLNVLADQGVADLSPNSVSGLLNVNAGELKLSVNTGALNLGEINVSGDPLIQNANGSVFINSSINVNAPLAIVSAADILTIPGVAPISITTNGNPLTMVAGAKFVSSNGGVLITGGTIAGGNIDLSSVNPVTAISSASATGKGGALTLVAFGGECPNCGRILLPNAVTLNSKGAAGFASGDITVIAGGIPSSVGAAPAITMGAVSTVGGNNGTGNITVATATPLVSTGGVSVDAAGNVNGSFSVGSIQNTDLIAGALSSDGGVISIQLGGNLTINGNVNSNSLSSNGGTVNILSNSSTLFTVGSGFAGNGISGLINPGSSAVNASSASITALNAGILIQSATDLQSIGLTGRGGNLSFVTGPTQTVTLPAVFSANGATSGNSTSGGNITVTAGTLAASGGSASLALNTIGSSGGKGGTINLTLGGLGAGLTNLSSTADGGGTGAGGNVMAVFGQNISAQVTANARGNAAASGGTTSLIFNGNLTNSSSVSSDVSANGTGNGGTITFKSNATSNSNSLNLLATAQSGNGGTVNFTSGVTQNPAMVLNVDSSSQTGNGGAVNFSTAALSVGSFNLSAASKSALGNGNGGTISGNISSDYVNNNSSASSTIDVSAAGNGRGGTIQGTGGAGTAFTFGGQSADVNDLSFNASGGANGGNLSVLFQQDSNINGATFDTSSSNGNGGPIVVLYNTNLLDNGGITANANGASSGGTVNFTVNGTTDSTSLTLTSTSGSGTGGTINSTLTGATGASNSPVITINANSDLGNGGTATLNATGDLNLEGLVISSDSNFAAGGSSTLTAKGALNSANLSMTSNSAVAGGNGGVVGMTVNGAYAVNNAVLSADGSPLGGNGGSVTINLSDLVTYNIKASASGAQGNGGTVTTFLASASGSVTTLDIDTAGAQKFQAIANGLAGNGSGGTIFFNAGSLDLNVNTTAGVSVSHGASSGQGGGLFFTGKNVVLSGDIDVSGLGDSNGGNISITGTSLTKVGNTNLLLKADAGSGFGNGGIVAVDISSSSQNVIIGAGNGNFTFFARGGANGGDGGQLKFLTGGTMTVDPAMIDGSPNPAGFGGNGAIYTLQAGASLIVSAAMQARAVGDDKTGGQLNFTATSGFVRTEALDAAAYTNSSNTGLSGTGGSIQITMTDGFGDPFQIGSTWDWDPTPPQSTETPIAPNLPGINGVAQADNIIIRSGNADITMYDNTFLTPRQSAELSSNNNVNLYDDLPGNVVQPVAPAVTIIPNYTVNASTLNVFHRGAPTLNFSAGNLNVNVQNIAIFYQSSESGGPPLQLSGLGINGAVVNVNLNSLDIGTSTGQVFITADGTGTNFGEGSGGTINLTLASDIIITDPTYVHANANQAAAGPVNGGTLNFKSSGGTIQLSGGDYQVQGYNGGNGGTIILDANNGLTVTNNLLAESSGGGGNGGTIAVYDRSNAGLTIGQGVSGGSYVAGNISVNGNFQTGQIFISALGRISLANVSDSLNLSNSRPQTIYIGTAPITNPTLPDNDYFAVPVDVVSFDDSAGVNTLGAARVDLRATHFETSTASTVIHVNASDYTRIYASDTSFQLTVNSDVNSAPLPGTNTFAFDQFVGNIRLDQYGGTIIINAPDLNINDGTGSNIGYVDLNSNNATINGTINYFGGTINSNLLVQGDFNPDDLNLNGSLQVNGNMTSLQNINANANFGLQGPQQFNVTGDLVAAIVNIQSYDQVSINGSITASRVPLNVIDGYSSVGKVDVNAGSISVGGDVIYTVPSNNPRADIAEFINLVSTVGGITVGGDVKYIVQNGGNTGGTTTSINLNSADLLQVQGDLTAAAGTSKPGTITIASTNGDLNIGNTNTTSYIGGSVTAAGGTASAATIGIANNSGAIIIDKASNISLTTISGDGGILTLLSAAGSGVTIGGGTLSANAALNGNGGQITINSDFVSSSDNTKQTVFLLKGAGSGTGGSFTVNNSNSDLSIGPSSAYGLNAKIDESGGAQGGTLTLNSSGALTLGTAQIILGGSSRGGFINLNAGGDVQINGNLNVTAPGASANGIVVSTSFGAVNINGDVLAGSQSTGAGAMFINAFNQLHIFGKVDASQSAISGAGGTITLSSFTSNVVVDGGVTATGFGTGQGGSITITGNGEGGNSSVGGAVDASGGGNGNGGTINIKTTGASLALGSNVLANGFAKGGSITIDARGTFTAKGNISSNAGAGGIAGTVLLFLEDGGTLAIGSNTGPSYITGTLGASTVSGGQGGSVTLRTQNSDLNLLLNSTISAAGPAATAGSINLDGGGVKQITLSGSANGFLNGILNVNASSANLSLISANSAIQVGQLKAVNGALTLNNTGSGSSVLLTPASNLSASGALTLSSPTVTNAGNIQSVGILTLTAKTLTNNANIQSTGANVLIDSATFVNNVVVRSGIASAVNISNSSGGDLIVSGTGSFVSNSLSLLNTSGSINLTQQFVSGTLYADAAKSISITIAQCTVNLAPGGLGNGIIARNGDISIAGNGRQLNITSGTQLTAGGNILVASQRGIALGDNVSFSAGQLASGVEVDEFNAQVLPVGSIKQAGGITLDTYLGGNGFGDITLGNGVSLVGNGGNVNLTSASNITTGTQARIIGWGGNVNLVAGNNITIGNNSRVLSDAALNGGGLRPIDIPAGYGIPGYNGGGVAIFVGVLGFNANAFLLNRSLLRNGVNSAFILNGDPNGGDFQKTSLVIPPPPPPPPAPPPIVPVIVNETLSNGNTIITVIDGGYLFEGNGFSSGVPTFNITNSNYESRGGVLVLDPPAGTITAASSTFIAVAPTIQPLPPSATPILGGPPIIPGVPTDRLPIFVSTPSLFTSLVYTDLTPVPADDEQMSMAFLSNCKICGELEIITPQGNERRSEWQVVMSQCQRIRIKGRDDDSFILGAPGTTLSVNKDSGLVLKEGKVAIVSSGRPISVLRPMGNVTVAPYSVVIIDATENTTRVASVDGGTAQFTLNNGSKTETLKASAGQEVVVADPSAEDEEMIPVDGVDRVAISGTISIAGAKVQTNQFDQQEMAAKEPLLDPLKCKICQVTNQRMQALLRRLGESLVPPTPPLKSEIHLEPTLPGLYSKASISAVPFAESSAQTKSIDGDESTLVPIAFATPAPSAAVVKSGIHTLQGPTVTCKHDGRSRVSIKEKMVLILEGESLVVAKQEAFVKAGKAVLHLQPGAVALVRVHKGRSYIRNIFEPRAKAVEVIVGTKRSIVTVGCEMVVAPPSEKLERVFIDTVGRRRLVRYDERGSGIFVSEVSMISLIMDSELLSKLFQSAELEDKSLSSRILKMAACLSLVTSGHGTFGQAKDLAKAAKK